MPVVPVPAPAKISPVGRSSTNISITFFCLSKGEILTSASTVLKNLFALILFIDLSNNILLNASPSSTIKTFLITFYSVIKFPNILICST